MFVIFDVGWKTMTEQLADSLIDAFLYFLNESYSYNTSTKNRAIVFDKMLNG